MRTLYSLDFQCSSNNGRDATIDLASDESKAEISRDRDREFGDRIINRRSFPQTSIEGVRSASIQKLLSPTQSLILTPISTFGDTALLQKVGYGYG